MFSGIGPSGENSAARNVVLLNWLNVGLVEGWGRGRGAVVASLDSRV